MAPPVAFCLGEDWEKKETPRLVNEVTNPTCFSGDGPRKRRRKDRRAVN